MYFFILFGVVFWLQRKETHEDFLIAGRNRTWWQVLFSKFAASIGVGWFVTYTAYAYEFGLATLGLILGVVVGYVLFAFWVVPKIYQVSRDKKFYTIGDVVEFLTGGNRNSRKILDYFSMVIQFTWLVIAFVGGAKVMSVFGLISYETALLLTAFIVLAYLLIGGFRAVMVTDVAQSIIILVLFTLIIFSTISNTNLTTLIHTEVLTLKFGDVIGLLIYGVFSSVVFADRYQIIFSAKNQKQATFGFLGALVPIVLSATLIVFLGLFIRMQDTTLDPALVFVYALEQYVDPVLLPLAIVVFFAGLMSSADSGAYAVASHKVAADKKTGQQGVISMRKNLIITTVCATLVSFFFRDIVDITVFSAGLSLVPSIAMLYLFTSRSPQGENFTFVLLLSLVGLFIGILIFGMSPSIAIFPILIGAVTLGISLVLQKYRDTIRG